MTMTRVLVAHDGGMRAFNTEGRGTGLTLAADISFEKGRLRNRELDSDRPGRTFSSAGHGRHLYEPQQDAHEHEVEKFARAIANDLSKELHAGAFQQLVLVAPPRMLGMLKAALDAPLKQALVGTVPKDLPRADEGEIADQIKHLVWC